MEYKVGDKVRQTEHCCGTIAGKIYIVKNYMRNGNKDDGLWIWDEKSSRMLFPWGCSCQHLWKPVTSRSSIGKKAYRTFLKNGGKRDEKGRFSKKPKISWEWSGGENIFLGVHKPPKIQVDWEKVNLEVQKEWKKEKYEVNQKAEAAAKVFKKHNLLREGVEI